MSNLKTQFKIRYIFKRKEPTKLVSLSSGPAVLRHGVRERRRPDVSDSALAEVRRGAISFLRGRGHVRSDVPAPARSHIQVITQTASPEST